jgi:hypothetical protein
VRHGRGTGATQARGIQYFGTMTNNQNPFARSDLNMELRQLLAAGRGIADAEALKSRLPQLQEHPAVLSHTPETGGRHFQRALEHVLSEAIARSSEEETTKRAFRWHIALDKGEQIESPNARLKEALRITGLSDDGYWKQRKGKKVPVLSIALESIETVLGELGEESLGRPTLKVGGVVIPDVLVLAACSHGQDMTEDMILEFEDELRQARPDCKEWPLISTSLLVELKNEAETTGRTFYNGEILDLVHAKELDPLPGAPRRYRLGVAETSYNRWAATANSLDRDLSSHRELTERLGSNRLRRGWGHAPDCLEDLAELPAPCFIGVCVVVVAEEQIIVFARQRMHHVAGAEPSSADRSRKPRPVHFVGEGVEPGDMVPGEIPPEHAALRGCWEELKLEAGDIELIPTAFVFDTLRWQPLFCYLARCKLTTSELETRMQGAEHGKETGRQIAARLPWTVTDSQTQALLTGSDPSMRLASNHAEAALLYALVYADGLERVASETQHAM